MDKSEIYIKSYLLKFKDDLNWIYRYRKAWLLSLLSFSIIVLIWSFSFLNFRIIQGLFSNIEAQRLSTVLGVQVGFFKLKTAIFVLTSAFFCYFFLLFILRTSQLLSSLFFRSFFSITNDFRLHYESQLRYLKSDFLRPAFVVTIGIAIISFFITFEPYSTQYKGLETEGMSQFITLFGVILGIVIIGIWEFIKFRKARLDTISQKAFFSPEAIRLRIQSMLGVLVFLVFCTIYFLPFLTSHSASYLDALWEWSISGVRKSALSFYSLYPDKDATKETSNLLAKMRESDMSDDLIRQFGLIKSWISDKVLNVFIILISIDMIVASCFRAYFFNKPLREYIKVFVNSIKISLLVLLVSYLLFVLKDGSFPSFEGTLDFAFVYGAFISVAFALYESEADMHSDSQNNKN